MYTEGVNMHLITTQALITFPDIFQSHPVQCALVQQPSIDQKDTQTNKPLQHAAE